MSLAGSQFSCDEQFQQNHFYNSGGSAFNKGWVVIESLGISAQTIM